MIRSELVTRVAEQNAHLYPWEVEMVVDAILGRIAEALAEGDRVELRDFGTFEVRRHGARSGCNPKTGEKVTVAAKALPHFKAGKALRTRLNAEAPDPEREAVRRLPAS
ncbi:integration host factor subunit beta [Methylobacterium sp. NEAU 140]|uniref:integration host factor subunit beta n=1 Tax=Methylobacterium sp. NEAU 140 TaxID=3064945 RepID=UPI00273434B2|nr:integration host factor subunit beta [Methylobacterium sp. NEAU 140]MDP4026972.1 integration host factor subunit beta [Methylobacterium sp. NEAU 140]